MATYVKDKSGAFRQVGDQSPLPAHRRSEARMKSYMSATDARAWGNINSENKQYIIDIMGVELPKTTPQSVSTQGKYIPVDILVKTLMGNKDADIKRLNAFIREMMAFINELKLDATESQKYTYLKSRWGAGDFGDVHKSHIPISESKYGRTSSEARLRSSPVVQGTPRTSSESRISTTSSPRADMFPSSASERDSLGHHEQKPLSSKPYLHGLKHSTDTDSTYNTAPSGLKVCQPIVIESSHKDVQVGQSIQSRESHTQTILKPKVMMDREQQMTQEDNPLKSKSSSTSLKSRIPVPGPTGDSRPGKITQTPLIACHDIQTAYDAYPFERKGSSVYKMCIDCEANLKKSSQTIYELDCMKKVLDERTSRLEETEKELETLKEKVCEKENIDEDIVKMANEITKLRAAGGTDELKIVSTELQLVKKYCQKLIYIKADNKLLKQENENLRRSRQTITRSVETLREHHHTLIDISACSIPRRMDPNDANVNWRAKLQEKVVTLREVTRQRDKYQASVAKLESKLQKYERLNDDIKVFKERTKVLDAVIAEKLSLERRLQRVSQLENEMTALKIRADKADELQRALENAQSKLLQMHGQQQHIQSQASFSVTDNNVAALVEDLKFKTREAEVLRIERDRMSVRLEELSHIEHEYKVLQGKCRMMDALRNERDIYKTKSLELASLKDDYISLRQQADEVHSLTEERGNLKAKVCELEGVISDQENEIGRLVLHIDRLSKGADKHQDKIKEIITELRIEIDNKNMLIATSETQLADVQAQLKETIDSLTTETGELRREIAHANASCVVLKSRLERLAKQLTDANVALDKEKKTSSRYKAEVVALNRDNQRLQEIADRMNDLTDAGKLETLLRQSHMALQTAAEKLIEVPSPRSNLVDTGTNTKHFWKQLKSSRSLHATHSATTSISRHAESRQQVSSLLTGIKNIPTHDYDAGFSTEDASGVYDTEEEVGSREQRRTRGSSVGRPGNEGVVNSQGERRSRQSSLPPEDQEAHRVGSVPRDVISEEGICLDSSETRRRLFELEERGVINLRNIKCACRGVQHPVCECTSDISKPVEFTKKRIPPCRRNVDAATICVDTNKDRLRLQQLQAENKLSLGNITCMCRGTQVEVCDCVDDDVSTKRPSSKEVPSKKSKSIAYEDSAETQIRIIEGKKLSDHEISAPMQIEKPCPPCRRNVDPSSICVDSVENQLRFQQLEQEGKLSLDNVTCICRGTQAEVCECKDDQKRKKGADRKSSDRKPTGSKDIPPCRKDLQGDTDVCVDNILDLQRLQQMDDDGTLDLGTATCVCKGVQAEVCVCPIPKVDRSVAAIKSRSASTRRGKEVQQDASTKYVPPCRKGSDVRSDTICADDIQELRRLQELDQQGISPLGKYIKCVCKGAQTEICGCIDDAKVFNDKTPPCSEGLDICVDNLDELQHYQAMATEGGLLLDSNIFCVCRGAQTELCLCVGPDETPFEKQTSATRSSEMICVSSEAERERLEQLEAEGKITLDNIKCACKGTQAEVCVCAEGSDPKSPRESIDANVDPLSSVATVKDDSVGCVCKGTQVDICECKSIGTSPITSALLSDNVEELQEKLIRSVQDLGELQKKQDLIESENQSLRKHASEIKEVAKSQILTLSNELKKSREDWGKTDDSKTMADLQEQNKLMQRELEMLKKVQCECSLLFQQKLQDASIKSGPQPVMSKSKSILAEGKHDLPAGKADLPSSKSMLDTYKSSLPLPDQAAGGLPATKSAIPSYKSDLPADIKDMPASKSERALPTDLSSSKPDVPVKKHDISTSRSSGPGLPRSKSDVPSSSGKPDIPWPKSILSSVKSDLPIYKPGCVCTGTQSDECECDKATSTEKIEKSPCVCTGTQSDECECDKSTSTPKMELSPCECKGVQTDICECIIGQSDQISASQRTGTTASQMSSIPEEIPVETDSTIGPASSGTIVKTSTSVESKQLTETDSGKTGSLMSSIASRRDDIPDDVSKASERPFDDYSIGEQSKHPDEDLASQHPVDQTPSASRKEQPSDTTLRHQASDATVRTQRPEEHKEAVGKEPEAVEKGPEAVEKKPEAVEKESEAAGKEPEAASKAKEPEKKDSVVTVPKKVSSIVSKRPEKGDAVPVDDQPQKSKDDQPKKEGGPSDDFAKKLKDCTDELEALRRQLEKCREELEAQKKANQDYDDLLRQLADLKRQLAEEQARKAPAGGDDNLRRQLEERKEKPEEEERKIKTTEQAKEEKRVDDKPGETTDKPKEKDDGPLTEKVTSHTSAVQTSRHDKVTAKDAAIADFKKKLGDSQQKLKESNAKINTLTKELEKTKKQSIEALKSARSSYEKNVMSMQEKYIEGIESLQSSHEETVSQGNAELEAEIESLRQDSMKKQSIIDSLQCVCDEEKKKKANLCQVQVQCCEILMEECECIDMLFTYLLKKILYCGLETLTFEDLQYMHEKICDATSKVMSSVKKGEYGFGPCSCDYRTRQTQAQTQVAKLQMEVSLERQRLESLKKALDIERSTQASMAQHFQRQAKIYMPYVSHQSPHQLPPHTGRSYITKPSNNNLYERCASAVELNPKRMTRLESLKERQSSSILKY